jgi:hypothetical protein
MLTLIHSRGLTFIEGRLYVDPKNKTMGCPNLVQIPTLFESPYTMSAHHMPIL